MNTKDHRLFASSTFPFRMSALPSLAVCPMKEFLLWEGLLDDQSGGAAQTGSAAHAIIEYLHTVEFDFDAARRVVGRSVDERWPLADWETAQAHAAGYSADPRNINARLDGRPERRVELVLTPHELDPTGLPIVLHGTIDQIRVDQHGKTRVFDVKTGKQPGYNQLTMSAMQLAAYSLAVDADLPPALICTNAYLARGVDASSGPPGVFQFSTLTKERCLSIIERVKLAVALIRRGNVEFGPGYHCGTICPARELSNCMHLFERFTNASASQT